MFLRGARPRKYAPDTGDGPARPLCPVSLALATVVKLFSKTQILSTRHEVLHIFLGNMAHLKEGGWTNN
jgi:hypothetical protein